MFSFDFLSDVKDKIKSYLNSDYKLVPLKKITLKVRKLFKKKGYRTLNLFIVITDNKFKIIKPKIN